MPFIVPKTCVGGLHNLEWIVDGEFAVCKGGHNGILWVVADNGRLRCDMNPTAVKLAQYIVNNRIIRQNPDEDQIQVSLQIAENLMHQTLSLPPALIPEVIEKILDESVVSAPDITSDVDPIVKAVIVKPSPKAKKAAKPKIQKPVVEKVVAKEVLGTALRGQRNNTKYLPEGVICRSHEEYKEWRQTVRMGQREVAKVLLLSRGLISDIDIGRRPYSSFVSYQFSMYMKDKAPQGD